MKTIYKTHEITVTRERCLGGWSQLFYAIFRVSDGYECTSGFSTGDETAEEFTSYMKERVDAELSGADPWGEKSKDAT